MELMEWLKRAGNDGNLLKKVENGKRSWKWLEIACIDGTGWIWLEIAGTGLKCDRFITVLGILGLGDVGI